MTILLALLACNDPCFSNQVSVEVAEDYSGPTLDGVDAEFADGSTLALAYSEELQRWDAEQPAGTEYNPLVSATLLFAESSEDLSAEDFEESSAGGGFSCENFFYSYVLSDAE